MSLIIQTIFKKFFPIKTRFNFDLIDKSIKDLNNDDCTYYIFCSKKSNKVVYTEAEIRDNFAFFCGDLDCVDNFSKRFFKQSVMKDFRKKVLDFKINNIPLKYVNCNSPFYQMSNDFKYIFHRFINKLKWFL